MAVLRQEKLPCDARRDPFTRVRYTYTYSDFRKTGPYVEPWHAQASDSIAQNDVDYVTTSLKYGAAVTADDTSMRNQTTSC